MTTAQKKKFRLRSRYSDYRFRDCQFRNNIFETDSEELVEQFKKESTFGPGLDVWLEDQAETAELVTESAEKPSDPEKPVDPAKPVKPVHSGRNGSK